MGILSEMDMMNRDAEDDAFEVSSDSETVDSFSEEFEPVETPKQEPQAEDAEEARKKAEFDAAEAKRKAEWEAKQAQKKLREQQELDRLAAMSDDDVMQASMNRVSQDTERLTRRKIVCTLLAVLGAVCISGVFTGSRQDPRGIAFGLAAALLYCSLILLNKRLRGLDTLETTFCQLCTAALVMLPYVLLGGHLHGLAPAPSTLFLLLVVGIVHTGLVYILFFSAVGRLPAQTTAVLSYVDPVTAILLATLFLHQPFGLAELCGTVLILGATLANELPGNRTAEAQS